MTRLRALIIGTILAVATAAAADCVSHSTWFPGGKIIVCTTCCWAGHCTTTCY